MDKFIPLSVPHFCGNEKQYVVDAVISNWVSAGGPAVAEFESKIASYTGGKFAVAVQSGTAGLHLACIASGITTGDEVLVPTLTFIAAVNPIKYTGAVPVFIDCDDFLCIDIEKMRNFCENQCYFKDGKLVNKKTNRRVKAVVAVHIFGNLCDMDEIMKLASKYNLQVIEDATESLGSYFIQGAYKGRHSGTIGDVGVYSFNGNKIITTGGGGMIVTGNEKTAKHTKYLSTQAKDDEVYFIHNEIGYNYRMTNVQAALGIGQLEQIETFIETKKQNYQRYIKNGLHLLPFSKNIRPNYWFYSFLSKDRDVLIRFLQQKNIQARPLWQLNHRQKTYASCQMTDTSRAAKYYDRIVNIPCSSSLTTKEVDYVSECILAHEKNH
jgi:aminotransferase in exopolysaccharide biosynthesis